MSVVCRLGSLSRRLSPSRLVALLAIQGLWIVPLFLVPATRAAAAHTYTVTVNTDDYSGTPATLTGNASNCPANGTGASCSLRDAITAANADAGSTIKFAVTGTNTLKFVLPPITASTTVQGPGASALTISGGYQQFWVSGSTVTATISGLTLANANNTVIATGLLPSYGGAIYNLAANLTVDQVVFVNNTTGQPTLPGEGGAILNNTGTLTVIGCSFLDNSTQYNGLGGAITNVGTLKITGSTFYGNSAFSGAAIYSLSGFSITDSSFIDNAVGYSGTVMITNGTLAIANSTFLGNTAGFGPNVGTALFNDGSPGTSPATLAVTNSIFDTPANAGGAACATTASPSDCPVDGVSGNLVESDASLKLSSFGNHGGPTPTVLPLAGSPAHCAASSANFPGTDQRGFSADPSCGSGLVDAGSVQTHYLTVTTAADDDGSTTTCGSTCTLRDAISAAVAANEGDIAFASSLTGSSISLSSPLPTINVTGSLDLVGPGASALTISGSNASQILNIAAGTVDISGLTFANGSSTSGGAIQNAGTLSLSHTTFTANSAGTGNGGAILNTGTLAVSDSTFWQNAAANGSAISSSSSVPVSVTYSTFFGNTASQHGAIAFSGGPLVVSNSTFAANMANGGTPGASVAGGGLYDNNGGTLAVTNSILAESTECATSGPACPVDANSGNRVAAANLKLQSAPAFNGGDTPTVLPLPGSAALCAASAALIPSGAIADQRGFPNLNTTYTGYTATAPCVDSGAVQTNYTAAQFIGTSPYLANANTPGQAPPVILAVVENGQNIGGIPVTLTYSGSGTATGLTATTVAGTGANFSSLTISQAAASGDTLSATIPVIGSDTLSAGPVSLVVKPQGAATVTKTSNVTAGALDSSVTLSATVTSNSKAVTEGKLSFTITLPNGAGTTMTASVSSSGTASVVYPLPVHLAGSSYAVSISYTDFGGSFGPSTAAAQLTVNKITPTVSTWPTAGAITYGQTLASSVLSGGKASVAGSFAFTAPATEPNAGTAQQSVTFTPSDLYDYNTVIGTASVKVNQASQTITFTGLPSTATVGSAGPYTLNAKASSGLAATYSVSGPASISGSTLTITGPGTVVVTAAQSGNANYLAAPSASQTIVVSGSLFTLTVDPSTETLQQGGIGIFLLTLQSPKPYSGNITLTCSGGPAGSLCASLPSTVNLNYGIALALAGIYLPPNASSGTYTLTFTATSGSMTSSATVQIVVNKSSAFNGFTSSPGNRGGTGAGAGSGGNSRPSVASPAVYSPQQREQPSTTERPDPRYS